jgi:uncharacterized protein (AIM24 family)
MVCSRPAIKLRLSFGFFRAFAGESMFCIKAKNYTNTTGSVQVVPHYDGNIEIFQTGSDTEPELTMNWGCYLASSRNVTVHPLPLKAMGVSKRIRSMQLFFGTTRGTGVVALCGSGELQKQHIEAGKSLIINNEYVVAWETEKFDMEPQLAIQSHAKSKQWKITRAMKSWLAGSGIMLKLTAKHGGGGGYIYTQTRGNLLRKLERRLDRLSRLHNTGFVLGAGVRAGASAAASSGGAMTRRRRRRRVPSRSACHASRRRHVARTD